MDTETLPDRVLAEIRRAAGLHETVFAELLKLYHARRRVCERAVRLIENGEPERAARELTDHLGETL